MTADMPQHQRLCTTEWSIRWKPVIGSSRFETPAYVVEQNHVVAIRRM